MAINGWPEIEGIDSAKALQLTGGDLNLFIDLLKLFLAENDDSANKVKALFELGQSAQAQKVLHKLKGQAGCISAIDLEESAATLENAVHSGLINLSELVMAFEQTHVSLCDAIRAWLVNQNEENISR